MDPLLMAFLLGLLTVACGVGLMALGAYVIKRYPNDADPARNARRFTVPAGIMVFGGSFALAGTIGALVFAIAT